MEENITIHKVQGQGELINEPIKLRLTSSMTIGQSAHGLPHHWCHRVAGVTISYGFKDK